MRDHRGDGRVAEERRAEIAEGETPVTQGGQEAQRGGGAQEAERPVGRQVEAPGQIIRGHRPVGENPETGRGAGSREHLRVDEAGAEIEQAPGVARAIAG